MGMLSDLGDRSGPPRHDGAGLVGADDDDRPV